MNLSGKTCLVTGANSGLGLATAKQFAKSGANVVLVCRDSSKGKTALADIKKEVPDASLELMICDLTSIKSIQNFLNCFREKHSSLNILFNNAAVLKTKRTITQDGFETMFQTNYLAPVMLTNSLLDLLKSSTPARIINIAVPPDKLRIDFEDLQSIKQYKSFDHLMKTKLYLLLYSIELSKKSAGTGIIINSIDPGMFKSELGREFPRLLRRIMTLCAQSADKAAENIIFQASSNEARDNSGKIYVQKKEKPFIPYWNESDVRNRLWSVTESMISQYCRK